MGKINLSLEFMIWASKGWKKEYKVKGKGEYVSKMVVE